MSTNETGLLTEVRDHVMILTINRNFRRNAIDSKTSYAMEEAINAAEKDPDIKAIILTAVGDQAFCSGEDLYESSEEGGFSDGIAPHGFGGMTYRDSPLPIICALNGHAIAGGFELALMCDIIVAADHIMVGMPEIKRGLLATDAVMYLSRVTTRQLAYELLLTGNNISVQRAYEIGLVNAIVPKEKLMEKAMEYATTIAANAPISIKVTKDLVRVSEQLSVENAKKYGDYCWNYIASTEDALEGARAYVEKRDPVWKGR